MGAGNSVDGRHAKMLDKVKEQQVVVENQEVKVLKLAGAKPEKKTKEGPFQGFLQRQAYFVIPKISKQKMD